jgi:hypothetical protein
MWELAEKPDNEEWIEVALAQINYDFNNQDKNKCNISNTLNILCNIISNVVITTKYSQSYL